MAIGILTFFRTFAFRGELGEHLQLSIHLKLRPNIGLVGFPNAGKSTLLKAFVPSREVKIASYPFTTTRPQVSVMNYKDENFEETLPFEKERFSLTVADLPGLIEGASRNRGCGKAFLKHLEYSEMLIIVSDVFGFIVGLNYNLEDRHVF